MPPVRPEALRERVCAHISRPPQRISAHTWEIHIRLAVVHVAQLVGVNPAVEVRRLRGEKV